MRSFKKIFTNTLLAACSVLFVNDAIASSDSLNKNSPSAKIQWGPTTKFVDQGLTTRLASSTGLVFNVHDYNQGYWSMIGKVENDNSIKWSNKGVYDKGRAITALTASENKLIEMHQHSDDPSKYLYKVGSINGDNVKWGGSIDVPFSVEALTSDGGQRVIGINGNTYSLGVVLSNNTIDWKVGGENYAQSVSPTSNSITFLDGNKVIAVVNDKNKDYKPFYKVGTMVGDRIEWSNGKEYLPLFNDRIFQINVTYDKVSHKLIFVYCTGEYRGDDDGFFSNNGVYYRTGTLNADDTISLGDEVLYEHDGTRPQITANNGTIVETHTDYGLTEFGSARYYKVGKVVG